MVEVSVQAQWFAKGAARGVSLTRMTFFEGDTGPWAGSDQWAFADEPADHAYLRDSLFALGVVAAGLLLARRGTQGGASLSPSSGAGGTRVDASDRTASEPAEAAVPPSGPAREPVDDPGEAPALRRPEPQEVVPPTTGSFVESPGPEVSAGRPTEDLDRAPDEGVPLDGAAGTALDAGDATVEEPPLAQEAERPPAEEAPGFDEELPPPPQASEVQLPPPLQPPEVELSPPPPVPEMAEELFPPPPAEETASTLDELPPPPEVAEAELAPPPPTPENILDELPPPPAPQEQSAGDVTPPEAPPSVEPVDEAPREEEPGDRKRVTATPAARRRARELGIDILEVEGTGNDGKITVDDVLREGE